MQSPGVRAAGHDGRIGVCYCIDRMATGGTENQLLSLIDGLDRQRFAPVLCTLRPGEMDLSGINCEILEIPFRSFGAISTLSSLRQLAAALRARQIAVVQTFFQDATILATPAAVLAGVPVRIASFRDLGFWRERNKVLQLRLVYPFIHGFIANSNAVARAIEQRDGLSRERIEVIYNGVAVSTTIADRVRQGPRVVGVIANLNRSVKRVDLFIRAAALLASRMPDVQFDIVGDGPLRGELEALAQSLGIAEGVRFRGLVHNAAQMAGSFDVGVLASDSEGLPNAVLEYMAAGVPTVARRVGGTEEVVRHGDTGLLVDSDDPADLAASIERLLVDEQARAAMGRHARALVAREFTVHACVRRHEAYHSRLLAKSASQSYSWIATASGGGG